jgi:hypothetical protein
MDQKLEAACLALDGLAESVIKMWSEDRIYTESFGWMGPAINRHELASFASKLADDIRAIGAETVPYSIEIFLNDLPRRIELLTCPLLPYHSLVGSPA